MSFGHTRKSIHRVRTHYLWEQNHSTKADETRNTPVHTQGTPRQGEMPPKGKEHYILAQEDLQHPATHREVYHMPGVWEISANLRHYPGTASFPMTHIGDRYVLLEKNGLSDSGRCILKAHHSEEIAKFHLISCVHRAIYDHNRIRPIPHN